MMADAQTDYLNDYWTNCKTATRNLSGDWLRCYDLLFLLQGIFKFLHAKRLCSKEFIVLKKFGVMFYRSNTT